MKVTKNIYSGCRITDLHELKRLADERKSVVIRLGMYGQYIVRPAAFMIHWPLVKLLMLDMYYAIKESEIENFKN